MCVWWVCVSSCGLGDFEIAIFESITSKTILLFYACLLLGICLKRIKRMSVALCFFCLVIWSSKERKRERKRRTKNWVRKNCRIPGLATVLFILSCALVVYSICPTTVHHAHQSPSFCWCQQNTKHNTKQKEAISSLFVCTSNITEYRFKRNKTDLPLQISI